MAYTRRFGGQNIYPSQLTYQLLTLTANVELQWPEEVAAPGVLVVSDIIDATGDAVDRIIKFPDATIAGPGQSILINNVGSNQILLHDQDDNEIGAVPSGEVWQLYLSDNTTVAGTWETFQFGTGTSSAVAAALAGAGLKAIGNTLNVQLTPRSSSSSPLAILNTDRAKVVQWTGGVGAGTLPNPATVGSDWFVLVRNNGTGTWTITPAAGTVDGAATLALSPFSSAIVYTDGTNYFTIGLSQVTPTNFDFTSINVAGTGNYVLTGTELNRISYRLTGNLSGNRSVIVPATVQQYWINNATTGAFSLTVKTLAGLGVIVPPGTAILLYCDGTDVIAAEGTPTAGVFPIARGGTNITTYTTGDLLYAGSTDVLNKLSYVGTASRYLGQNAGVPGWVQVNLANGVTGLLPFANMSDLSALSVLGRASNTAGVMAAITGAANQVLRVVGTTLGFGAVDLSTMVTGTLAVGNGGTGLTTWAQGDIVYASAANTLAGLTKSTDSYNILDNQGASNAPNWARPRFRVAAAANTDITFALADRWSWIPHSGAATQNWSIDTNANVPFTIGDMIGIDNRAGAGTLSIVPLGGVTLDGKGTIGTLTILPGYKGMLIKVSTNTWILFTDSPAAPPPIPTTVYAGTVASAAVSAKFNTAAAAWAASAPGTGVITITHNLGLAAVDDLSISPALVSAADDRTIMITARTVNSFDYTIIDVGSGAVNVPTSFIATRVA